MLPITTGVINLTRDAEVRATTETIKLIEISGAANSNEKVNGQWESRPSYYTLKVWLPKASKLTDFLVKGQAIQFSGELYQDRWEKDGTKNNRHIVNCQQSGIGLVGKKVELTESHSDSSASDNTPPPPPPADVNEDEIPF
jgi:single-stranded DNA-binding protein